MQIRLTFFSSILLSLVFLLNLSSCNEKSTNPEDPSTVFAAAAEPYDDGLYDLALQKLGQFKSRFPYSKHAAQTDLMIADSHYQLGNYQESAVAYAQFIKLHPRHPKVDFAQFRIGESYWIEAPEEVDREQDLTNQALIEWQILIDRFPKSEYSTKARERMALGRKRIARAEEFVMNFYCKQEIYHACAFRSIKILEDYQQFPDITASALKQAALSFSKLAEQKEKDPETDANIYVKEMSVADLNKKSETFRTALAKAKNNKKK